MADKMMRIAGRDSAGLAKAVKTDTNGNVGVVADAQFTYGWLSGSGGASGSKGTFTDWVLAKGSNEGSLSTGVIVTTQSGMQPYLNYTAFADGVTPTWIGIPIAAAGYRTFHVGLQSYFDLDCDVSAYLLPEIVGTFNGANIATSGGLLAQTIVSAEILAYNTVLNFGVGGTDKNTYNAWTAGYLVIKIAPTGIPTSGALRLGVERQK